MNTLTPRKFICQHEGTSFNPLPEHGDPFPAPISHPYENCLVLRLGEIKSHAHRDCAIRRSGVIYEAFHLIDDPRFSSYSQSFLRLFIYILPKYSIFSLSLFPIPFSFFRFNKIKMMMVTPKVNDFRVNLLRIRMSRYAIPVVHQHLCAKFHFELCSSSPAITWVRNYSELLPFVSAHISVMTSVAEG